MPVTLRDLWWQVVQEYGGLSLEAPITSISITEDDSTLIYDNTNLVQYSDDLLVNGWCLIGSEVRPIVALNNRTLRLNPGLNRPVEPGDMYRVWTGWPLPTLRQAALDALRSLYPRFYRLTTDESLAVVHGQYEYSLPPDLGRLLTVEIHKQGTDTYLDFLAWREDRARGKLLLSPHAGYDAGDTLRLTGFAPLILPTEDTDVVEVPAPYETALLQAVGLAGAKLLHGRIFPHGASHLREHLTMRDVLDNQISTSEYLRMPMPRGRTTFDWRG